MMECSHQNFFQRQQSNQAHKSAQVISRLLHGDVNDETLSVCFQTVGNAFERAYDDTVMLSTSFMHDSTFFFLLE